MRFVVRVLALIVAAGTAIAAQPPPESRNFARWVAEGERAEIPWKVRITRPELTLDQRLVALVAVELDGAKLNRHGTQHHLVLLANVAQEGGEWLGDAGSAGGVWLEHTSPQPLPRRTSLVFSIMLRFKPGRYRVGLVVVDRISGHRSATVRKVEAKAPSRDPLPQLFAGLPSVEMLPTWGPLDLALQRSHRTRRRLPIQNTRPLHLELVVGMADYHSRRIRNFYLAALEPLAALSVAVGSLRVTGIDLKRGRTVFDLDFSESPEWKELLQSLEEIDPHVVDFNELANLETTADFFTDFLNQRLRADLPAASPGNPLRIMIVLGNSRLLYAGKKVQPVTPPANCRCRVYYFPLRLYGWDDVRDVLKPLKPRVFATSSPKDYRRALAELPEELRQF